VIEAVSAGSAVPAARSYRLLQAIAAAFILVKLVYAFSVPPIFDEAYYWLWGQHPALSYFDHPPFHAWLLGLSDLVFGRSLFGLRWMTVATLAGTIHIFHIWARRFGGAEWRDYFWRAVVVYVASPTFGVFTSVAYHDYMLVFLCLVATHFVLKVLTACRETGRFAVGDLYVGAIVLGCAGLTKYSAVFLGLGLFAYIVSSRPLRPLLRSPHLYAAGLLAILMQAPVLIWNAQHGFASFRFHLVDRHPANWLERINLYTLADFLTVTALLVSPFLIIAIFRFLLSRQPSIFAETGRGLAAWVFALSSATFLYVSLFDMTFWWWNLVAYVPALPFLGKTIGRRLLFYGHVALGAVLAGYLLISSAVIPLASLVGRYDFIRVNLYGMELLEAPIRRIQAAHPTQFIAGLGAELSSVIGFTLDEPYDVTALTTAPNEFHYWFDPAAHAGQNAVVVLREGEDVSAAAQRFSRFTLIETVPVERFGVHISAFSFYLGEGYIPPPASPPA
jgi:hypothetical protein